jgi:hypothetical protein
MAFLTTASDAKTAASAGPTLPASPSVFDGSLADLAARHLVPALPSVDVVLEIHERLVQYVREGDPLFLVRQIRGTERRLDYHGRDGVRMRATDNSPAWWMYAALRAGHRIARDAISAVIETIPCHMFDVAPRSAPVPASAGWHIAHILNVKDRNLDYANWSRREVVRRFIRNIHPANYFLLPKVEWQRLGNDPGIVDYFAAVYRERYADIWDEYAELAEFDRPWPAGSLGATRVAFGGQTMPPPGGKPNALAAEPRPTGQRPAQGSPEVPVRHTSAGQGATLTYRASRLLFKRDLIEALPESGLFRVQTPVGDFEMTKAEFYAVFPGVTASRSYREGGVYHFPSPPKRAERFRVSGFEPG